MSSRLIIEIFPDCPKVIFFKLGGGEKKMKIFFFAVNNNDIHS